MDSLAPVALEPAPVEPEPGMMRSRLLRVTLVLLPLVFGASTATASLWVRTDVRTVTKRADAVVLGRVERVDATWTDGRILSDALVSVSAAYKGRTATEIHVRVPGGVVGGIRMRVSSEPELRRGDEEVLFVTQHDAEPGRGLHYHVVDGVHGAVPIPRDTAGNALVTWTRPETERIETTPLSAFGDYVHWSALQEAQ